MKKIIYTRADGGLSVVHPSKNARLPKESEDAFLERVRAKAVPQNAQNAQIIDAANLPTDRTFRNAWKAGVGKVEHDMVKCREIHRENLRARRKPLLEAADVEFMRASEKGESTAEIAARKQALRDVTADPAIDAASTPEELKRVLPAVLRAL